MRASTRSSRLINDAKTEITVRLWKIHIIGQLMWYSRIILPGRWLKKGEISFERSRRIDYKIIGPNHYSWFESSNCVLDIQKKVATSHQLFAAANHHLQRSIFFYFNIPIFCKKKGWTVNAIRFHPPCILSTYLPHSSTSLI